MDKKSPGILEEKRLQRAKDREPSSNGFQRDLFLSHSGADEKWARQLAARIEEKECQGRKLAVFLAKRDIQPAENWVTALQDALQVSRRVGIVLSPEALQSAFVEAEWTAAINRSLSSRQQLVIPLLLRDCAIPPMLSEVQYIDFRDPNRYEEALDRLIDILCEQPFSEESPISDGMVPGSLENHTLPPRELRKRVYDQLMRLNEDDLRSFLYLQLDRHWDDLPGSWKQPKILSLIQLYDLLGEGEYGLEWLYGQAERFRGGLQARLRSE
jgi:hypothetical protein